MLDSVDPDQTAPTSSYIDVFDESEKLLYEEIDYLNEAKNADRFREQFANDPQVRVPEMIYEARILCPHRYAVDAAMAYQPHAVGATPRRRVRELYTSPPRRRRDYRGALCTQRTGTATPKVLTMEFIESFKLTDIERVERRHGIGRTWPVADTFLYQIVDTAYFHCDPHPGNLAVDTRATSSIMILA